MEENPPKAELVIGICTKNCERTISNVIKQVDEGLTEFYPKKKSLIVVSDLSDDGTEKAVKETNTKNPVFFTRQDGGPGKGNGIRTVFRLMREAGSKKVALVDGDLTSISSKWIKALVEPLEDGYDLAVPYYERHKYDSVITNHVIYPFVTALYGAEVRQPIGGEFGLSDRLVDRLMKHPLFPDGFGIDIFITTTALAEGLKVAETALGVKSHASTESYKEFEKFLVPMFKQVVGTLFSLTYHNMDRLRGIREVRTVTRYGHIKGGSVAESVVDRKVLFNMFQRDFGRMMESGILSDDTRAQISDAIAGARGKNPSRRFWKNSARDVMKFAKDRVKARPDRAMRPDILSEETKNEIRRFIYGETGQIISIDTWVNAVYDAFNKFKDQSRREDAINVLMDVWLGRFSSFVRQTRFMDTRDAECMIRGQVNAFNEKKERVFGS